jgi:hypothetical protein
MRNASYSHDGKILAVGTAFWSFVQLFETGDWKRFLHLEPGVMGDLKSVSLSPGGATLTAAVYQSYVSIFDLKTAKDRRIAPPYGFSVLELANPQLDRPIPRHFQGRRSSHWRSLERQIPTDAASAS